MRVTKLKIGVYFQAQLGHAFCVYFFPHRTSPSSASSRSESFYRLRDLDVMFFNEDPGYIQRSGKLSPPYLQSPAHAFHENTGDVYMSATAVADAAKRLGNYLLAEFVTLSKEQISAGVGDEMLRSVPGFQWKQPFTESEEDLDSEVVPRVDNRQAMERDENAATSERDDSGRSPSKRKRKSSSPGPPVEEKRSDESRGHSEKSKQPASSKASRPGAGPREGDLEHDASVSTSKRPAGSDPAAIKRNRSDADFSGSAQSEAASDGSRSDSEDAHSGRLRTRKRLSINTSIAGNNLGSRQSSSTNLNATPGQSSASLDMIGNTLRLKQQQQAIIEARQYQQGQRGPMSANPEAGAGGGSGAAYEQSHRSGRRNSRNLTIRTADGRAATSRGAMTAPTEGPNVGIAHPPSAMHQGRLQSLPSASALMSPRHLNPAPGKSSKLGSRGAEASRYNASIHSANAPAVQSPRGGEFPSRELPLPPHYPHHPQPPHMQSQPSSHQLDREGGPPRSPLPPMNYSQEGRGGGHANAGGSKGSGNFPPQPPSPTSAYPAPLYQSGSGYLAQPSSANPFGVSKPAVMSFFESLFDQAEETARLQYTLRDQIRRSTAMLQTLQSSGQMIEGLVRGHFREMQVTYGEKFGAALHDLSRRVAKLEGAASDAPAGDRGSRMDLDTAAASGTNSASPGETAAQAQQAPHPRSSWGFKGGPPSANPMNGTPTSLFLGGDAGKGYELIVRGIMERLEKLEGGKTVPPSTQGPTAGPTGESTSAPEEP